jgi:REP element-mobilizing transposase RayT
MARLEHFYSLYHFHYLTANAYRKACIFDADRYKGAFVQILDRLRSELSFRIIGYVVLPKRGSSRRRAAEERKGRVPPRYLCGT